MIMRITWKRYRVVKSDSSLYPWKIQERYNLFFFFHWWDTPTFAPPHYFETYMDAIYAILNNVKNPRIEDLGKVITEDRPICKVKAPDIPPPHIGKMTVEKYIDAFTKRCSNEVSSRLTEKGLMKPEYHPWLTPYHAEQGAQLAREETIENIKEALLSEVLPYFMHGGEADEVVAKLDEVLSKRAKEGKV